MPKINTQSTVGQPDSQGIVRNASTDNVGASLLRFANAATVNEMNKEASRRYLEGQQAVAQGKTVQEVKDNQGFFTSLFGEGASVKGARDLATQNALDEAYRNSLNSIPEHAHLEPKEYAKVQQAELASYIDGIEDDETRQAITIGFSQKAAELAAMQTKAYAQHIDSENLKMYSQQLYSKGLNAQSAVGKGTETELTANRELLNAMVQPKGMGDEQYYKALTSGIVSSLGEGNGALYNQFLEMDLTKNLTDGQRSQIFDAYQKYEAEQLKEQSVEIGKSLHSLETLAETEGTTIEQLTNELQVHQERYGLTPDKVNSILNKMKTAQQDRKKVKDVGHLARTRQFHLISDKERPAALNQMRQEFGDQYPEYWATIGVKDTMLSKQWTNTFSSLVLPDGEPDPQFVAGVEDFMKYAAIDKSRAFGHITDDQAKARMQAILSNVQNGGDVVNAVRQQALREQNNNEGGFDQETRKEITKEVENVIDSTIMPNFLGGHDGLDSDNSDYVKARIKDRTEYYMRNGKVNAEDAAELARADFENIHEKVKGDYIPNGGTPFSVRLGLPDGKDVESFLDEFVEENGQTMWGEHDGDYSTVYNISNNSMTLIPVDDNGIPVHGGRTLSLDAIKADNKAKIAKEQEKQVQANALKNTATVDSRIKGKQMIHLRRWGKEISEEKALELINEQDAQRHQMKAAMAQTLFTVVPPLKALGTAPDLIRSIFDLDDTPGQAATKEALEVAVPMQIAIQSNSGMHWGRDTIAVTGQNEHIGYMLDAFAATESGSGKHLANPVSSARGVFQYLTAHNPKGNNSMQTAIVRAMRTENPPQWLIDLKDVAFNGTDEERSDAMVNLSDDRSAALMLMDFQGRPQTAALLERVKEGDVDAIRELYYKYHHTNPDPATTKLFEANLERYKR